MAVDAGPNLEARARAARFAVLPAGRGHRAHHGRPGRDDPGQPAARRRRRRAGRHGAGRPAPAARPAPARDPRAVRRRRPRRRCATRATTTRPSCATASATSCCRCAPQVAGRDPVPLLARQAGVLRDEVALLDALAAERAARPRRRPGRGRGAPAPLARRALRRWLRARPASGAHPPSLAEVDRVLAVAAGAAVGTELSGGRRVRRTGRPPPGRAGRRSGSVTPVTLDEAGAGVPSVGRSRRRAPCWSTPSALAARVAELGARDHRRLRRTSRRCWSPCSRAPCSS